MRIISAAVPRAVIDAGILAATYPGHTPARWALPLLDQLDARATEWQLVELDADALAALWLPPHAGEACHGDSMSLGDEGGVGLVVVDGLHRALGYWMAGHRSCQAYVPVIDRGASDLGLSEA